MKYHHRHYTAALHDTGVTTDAWLTYRSTGLLHDAAVSSEKLMAQLGGPPGDPWNLAFEAAF